MCEQLAADVADSIRLRSPVERITVSEGRAVGVRVAGQQVPAAAIRRLQTLLLQHDC